MIGKIFSHLLGNADEDLEAVDDTYEELMEFEEGGWVIVNLPVTVQPLLARKLICLNWDVPYAENGPLSAPEVDSLENLLIEHPSMSVYQMKCRMSGGEEEEEEEEEEEIGFDQDEEDSSRPVAVRQHISWRLAAWGIPLPCNIQLLADQRATARAERKKLSRNFLHRQNLTKLRFSPAEKRYGNFKQPCQRLYNY
ncbi:tumor protein p53-inducible nuclear protein 2 isoform X2 [Mastacembelus armatus]|nr:tumor protein p53-inducible nuclear protein 2-like isoform X2 [Mastacembelus armatus]XP_026149602.1 tumor protein p53-inducible nuclear protein 2-like isoform X2 [Mastacembelus armatus]